jgi:hypothetical protein
VSAQTVVTTAAEENLRREPQGQILGRLGSGTPLTRLSVRDSWSEVTLEGWIWTASLQVANRAGFDLVVSASGGENVRAEPSGPILGRLEEGTLLEELERIPGWARVRRTAFVWSASLSSSRSGQVGTSGGAQEASAGDAAGEQRFLRPGGAMPILSAPDGDTLALTSGSGDFEVLAREGNWVRVRLEGWLWRPSTLEASEADDGPAEEIAPEMLAGAGGEAYEGRRVRWSVQFISLERAEAIRTDFFEGEPFILGRAGGGDGPYVYVAVPPERVALVEGLAPLEMVTVVGRIRRASSALTDTPILDLLALEREPGR